MQMHRKIECFISSFIMYNLSELGTKIYPFNDESKLYLILIISTISSSEIFKTLSFLHCNLKANFSFFNRT